MVSYKAAKEEQEGWQTAAARGPGRWAIRFNNVILYRVALGERGGAGKPTGAAQPPRKSPTSKVAQAEDRLVRLIEVMGDAEHPYVKEQRRVLEDARQEEEARLSPADKAARLRKELAKAYDVLAETFIQIETLDEKQKELEEAMAAAEESAFEQHMAIGELKKDIGELEVQGNVALSRTSGPTVDVSPEAQLQRKCEEMLSI